MYRFQYKDIKITPESKILIGLGDSFVQGQGACSMEIWDKYDWDFKKMYNGNDDVLISEYEGSWVNQLCRDYLHGFIPINLGMRGCGNRAAVKELYLHPELNFEQAREKIVIFMLSGMERFDFVNDKFEDHHHFFTMWPNPWDKTATNPKLWEIYATDIWGNRFGVVELLLNIVEVQTWCKANNARFIVTSAFRSGLNRDYFKKILTEDHRPIGKLVDMIDWNNFLYPEGCDCMTDMLVVKEGRHDFIGGGFYGWAMNFDKLSTKKYFTKCAHPSVYGHKEIADVLYNFITDPEVQPVRINTPIQTVLPDIPDISNQIICSLEEWDSIIDYHRPNGSSKSWYLKELKEVKYPLMWGEWNVFTEQKELFTQNDFKNMIAPNYFGDIVKYVPIDETKNKNHLYIINVSAPSFFTENKSIGFSCISEQYKNDIREGRSKIIITLLFEGHSGSEGNDDLEIIEQWRKMEKFPENSVYFITGNLIADKICEKKHLKVNVLPIHMFEPWNWNHGTTYPDLPVSFIPEEKEYLYLSYNRQPRIHRIFFVHELIKHQLFDDGLVSLNKINEKVHLPFMVPRIMNFIKSNTPININNRYNLKYNLATNMDQSDYERTFISVISETLIEKNCLFLSEKIWKPIIMGHPFMIYGNQYTLRYLKNLGYKTFDKWIDESYDNEPDYLKRGSMIIDELKKIKEYSMDELHKIRNDMYVICQYNKDHFIELVNKNYKNGTNVQLANYIQNIWNDLNNFNNKKRLI